MTEKNYCYQCIHLKSTNLLTGERMTFGLGCCHDPFGALYQFPKYLSPVPEGCQRFCKRSPKELKKIEEWMDKRGITAYVRSMA